MTSARRRGFGAERELARILWDSGFAVIRAPASGAKSKHVIYPDLVAIYRGKIFIFEVKYRRSATLYVSFLQLQKLEEFARRASASAFVAVKIARKGWYIVGLDMAKKTRNGVKIDKEVLDRAYTLQEFINSVTNAPLDSFLKKREGGGSDG